MASHARHAGLSNVLCASIAGAVRICPLTRSTFKPAIVAVIGIAWPGSRFTNATTTPPERVRAADMLTAGTDTLPTVYCGVCR